MQTRKKWLALLLALLLALSQLSLTAFAAEADQSAEPSAPTEAEVPAEDAVPVPAAEETVASGTCGENLTWTLDGNGTLTISGTGPMEDYSHDGEPWNHRRTKVVSAVIEPGVTSIGDHAFDGCAYLTGIVIPDSVTSIGDHAFNDCPSLSSVTIPDGVTSIGDSTFYYCRSLISVTIPNSVTSIGDHAFRYCHSLISVTIPNSVNSIGKWALTNCDSLLAINVDGSNQYYTSVDGVLFSKDMKTLCQFPTGRTGEYQIPAGVTSIGDHAFRYCHSLISVTIPNSVTSIGVGAFRECQSLSAINVDDTNQYYTSVDGVLFSKDMKMLCQFPTGGTGKYQIPSGVTSIGDYAFADCVTLTSVTIPASVTGIGNGTFENCYSLSNVEVPDSVTSIGYFAFQNCESLTSVTIPDGVTTISPDTFKSTGLTSVVIPSSVTSIGSWAFRDCGSLTSVVIPGGVTSIGDHAFADCPSLTNVTVMNADADIETYAFGYNDYGDPIPGFTLSGYTGSTAQTYAEENELTFVSLGERPAPEPTPTPDPEPTPEPPQTFDIVPELSSTVHVLQAGEDAVIYCTGELDDFVRLLVDGQVVDPAYYTLTEGSTIVTLLSEYLDTLAVGQHTVNLEFTNGTAEGTITIQARTAPEPPTDDTPQTGDISRMSLWIAVAAVSGTGLLVLGGWRLLAKRRERS